MKDSIKKILKNFVFADEEMPEIRIETHETLEPKLFLYVVSAIITPDHEAYQSEDLRKYIVKKMETALSMLGFTGVNGQIINHKGIYRLRALGHYK